jgi:hypothetical protein
MKEIKMKIIFPVIIGFIISAVNLKAQHPAEIYGWAFDNFSDTLYNWDIYCHTFFGIPSDESSTWFTATFDKVYFELAFETELPTTGGGNCFGLSLLSLMMNKYGGYYGYCAPPISHITSLDPNGVPLDTQLKRAINIMHGRQLSLAAIQMYIDQAAGGHSQNATYGVSLAKQNIAKEGPVLVCITKELLPDKGGHTMIAYKVTDHGPGKHRIWLVDPNRIWADTSATNRGWYMGDSNYINVDGTNWTFRMAGKLTDWPTNDDDEVAGGSLGEGHLVIMPISVVGPPGRTPTSMGLSVLSILTKIIIWGNKNSYVERKYPEEILYAASVIGDKVFLRLPYYETVMRRALKKGALILNYFEKDK